MSQTVYESRIASLPLIARGKVRDIYAVGEQQMLIVTTDRLSAFDVILPDPIPDKGQRAARRSRSFWFSHAWPTSCPTMSADRHRPGHRW
jgi:phosphoribosylaminoimidazole-succinocarboxamide synthase